MTILSFQINPDAVLMNRPCKEGLDRFEATRPRNRNLTLLESMSVVGFPEALWGCRLLGVEHHDALRQFIVAAINEVIDAPALPKTEAFLAKTRGPMLQNAPGRLTVMAYAALLENGVTEASIKQLFITTVSAGK